jgi:hypothetical protein
VDTQGLVLRATVHPATSMDRDGVKLLLLPDTMRTAFPRLQPVWLDAGYNGRGNGKEWIEQTLGWSAASVAHRPYRKKIWMPLAMPPEQVEWFHNRPPRTFRVLPRRALWGFAWRGEPPGTRTLNPLMKSYLGIGQRPDVR